MTGTPNSKAVARQLATVRVYRCFPTYAVVQPLTSDHVLLTKHSNHGI